MLSTLRAKHAVPYTLIQASSLNYITSRLKVLRACSKHAAVMLQLLVAVVLLLSLPLRYG
jgi:hypothetical protein